MTTQQHAKSVRNLLENAPPKLATQLAKPWHYRRNGRYYLRFRPKGRPFVTFTLSLRTTDRTTAMELSKDILRALAVFHLDQPQATWDELKAQLIVIAEECLSMAHGDESLIAYSMIYDEVRSALAQGSAKASLNVDQQRALGVGQQILRAAQARLHGQPDALVEIIDQLNERGASDSQVLASPPLSVGPTKDPLSWDSLSDLYMAERGINLKDNTRKSMLTNFKVISEAFVAIGVSDLRKHTREDLTALRAKLLEGRAESTVNNLIQKLTTVLTWAVDNDKLAKAYASKLKITKDAESKREAFTRPQAITLMDYTGTLPADSWERWALSLAVITGARVGEIAYLTKADIKQVDGLWCIDINENDPGKSIKNKHSARMVPLVDGALDGGMFSVNDLRDFNLLRVVPQYDRRVNGDIAIMGGTGKSTQELKNLVNGMRQKAGPGKDTLETDALLDAIKMFTGRARRDPDGVWATFARSLNDVGFMTKNAYMGAQNITEAASLIVKGHQRMLLKGVPLLKQWTTAKAKLAPEDIKQMHGLLFGRELDDLIRPERQDIVDNLRQNSSEIGAQVAGSVKYATQELSARSPFTWLLRESGNYLMDAGRQGALVDLIDHTLNGKVTDLFSPERLRSASVSPEQFKGIQALIKAHFKQDRKSGKWRIQNPEGLASDVRSMDLYRLGDRVADEAMLRPHKMSFAPSKQYGAGWAMALQFKMFVLRSLNGRMARGWMEATRNGQVLDQTMQVLVSVGLATAFYAASAHTKALGLPERAREKYLEKALSPSMMAYAAISRSSHVGAPLGVANFISAPLGFDQAAMLRTSILPREKREQQAGRAIKYNPLQSDLVSGFVGGVAEQIPAANVAAHGVQAGYSAINLMGDQRRADKQGHMTGLWNALRQFVPNDPLSQSLMQRLAEDQGVDRAR